MKCPFLINKITMVDRTSTRYVKGSVEESFGNCSYDECPFYYKDEDDTDKCARCDGGPQEDLQI